MKKHFIPIICLICAVIFVASVAKAQDSDIKNSEDPCEQFYEKAFKAKQQGRYQEGILFAEKTYQCALRHFGKTHSNTLTCINNLALLYSEQGRYGEAEPLYKEVLQIREKVLGKEHSDTLISISNLALLYKSQGRYGEAEPLLKEVLQIREKVLGKKHYDTLASINNLAELFHSQGRYVEAEQLFDEILQRGEKVLHPNIPTYMNNLAGLYSSQGRYGEAELLYKKVLQFREKILSRERPDTLASINNLAGLYESQSRYGEAEPLYKEVLKLSEKNLGREHPHTLSSVNNLGGLYESQGRYGEAELLYKEALQLREKVLGKEHPDTLISISSLAGLYRKQGRYGEAEPLYKEALKLSEKNLGREHPYTLSSVNNLGGLYESQGRYGEAEPLYKEAFQLSEKVLGKEHPNTLTTQLNYIVLMINMKKNTAAFRMLTSIENLLFDRSFQELYTTSQDRVRRLYLNNIAKFQDVVFSFALKYPEAEYQRFAANIMLRWKQIYAEENTLQHQLLNITHNSELEKLKRDLTKLRTEFSQRINHNTGKRDVSEIWKDLQFAEYALRGKTIHSKTKLKVSDANLNQLIERLPKESALIEFRMFSQTDFKTGKATKPHLAVYLLLSDAKLFFEDIGEAEDILTAFNSKKSQNILYQKLFGKFDKHIKDLKTLYIAPDGFLNLIPFAALKLPDGRYLAERQQINQLQTGRDLLSSPPQKSSDVLIAVGGIDFGKSSDRKPSDKKGSAKKPDDIPKLNMRSGDELEGFASLPNSRKEAAAIVGLYESYNSGGKVVLLNDGKTTEGYLKQIVQSPRILHLSTHGFYLESKSKEQWAEEEPLLLSGLALADANPGLAGITDDKGDDGLLYAIEVTGLNLQGTELVSLSACDTGKGVVDYSEGVYGLVRAFRTAGAQSVLMTLSPVGDSDSKEFMVKFYEFWLSSNLTPAEAMHKTRLHFIKENRKPEFWSPYVLVGK